MRLRTATPEDTAALGRALAELVVGGDLVLLCGDLGAGKTVFAKGLGVGLGVPEPITSPTFTLVREYEGRLRLYHLDVYRLEHLEEAAELGLSELLDDGSVTLIEWGDVISPALPQDYLELHLHLGEADDERLIDVVAVGTRWSARQRVLAEVWAPWLEEGPSC